MITLAEVATYTDDLAGVTVGARWNNKTWIANGHGFAWQRPLSKADIERFGDERVPAGDIFAVIVENLDAKEAILAMDLPGFFTIPHFNGYAAVLIELRLARKKDVKAAIADAHRVALAKKPKQAKKAKKKR
jgi:hypothetical protein